MASCITVSPIVSNIQSRFTQKNTNTRFNNKSLRFTAKKRISTKCSNMQNDKKTSSVVSNEVLKGFDVMRFDSWAPELINGRCAMLGYAAGYGYEAVTHESLSNQAVEYWPYFVAVSVLVTVLTLKTGKPTKEDVQVSGLTPDAELFNGRAAMIGIVSTLLYEFMNKM